MPKRKQTSKFLRLVWGAVGAISTIGGFVGFFTERATLDVVRSWKGGAMKWFGLGCLVFGLVVLTLVFVDWWRDRKAKPKRAGKRVEVLPSKQDAPRQDDSAPLEIEAMPPKRNTHNRTEIGRESQNRPVGDGFCEIKIVNPNRSRELRGINVRVLKIDPPFAAKLGHNPDSHLCELPSMDRDNLNAGQGVEFQLFQATRHNSPIPEEPCEIDIRLCGGDFKADTKQRTITMEATAAGTQRAESKFTLSFSSDTTEGVFKLTKIEP